MTATERREIIDLAQQLYEERRGIRSLSNVHRFGTGDGGAVSLEFVADGNPATADHPALMYAPSSADGQPAGFCLTYDGGATRDSLAAPIRGLICVGGATAGTASLPGKYFAILDGTGAAVRMSDLDLVLNGQVLRRPNDYALDPGGSTLTMVEDVQAGDSLWIQSGYGRLQS